MPSVWNKKSLIHDIGIRDLCVHTEWCMVKVEQVLPTKRNWYSSSECITCLKLFSVGCVSPVNKSPQIVKIRKMEHKKRKNQMNGLFNINYFHFLVKLDHSICVPLLYITLHSFRKQMTYAHQSKKVKLLFLNTNCYFTHVTFFTFFSSMKQDHVSQLNISMLINKNSVKRYKAVSKGQRIKCN